MTFVAASLGSGWRCIDGLPLLFFAVPLAGSLGGIFGSRAPPVTRNCYENLTIRE